MTTLESKRSEFDSHVWNHSEDVFQQSFDFKQNLSPWEFNLFSELADALSKGKKEFTSKLTIEVQRDPLRILPILQVVGLTRSKILTDLKAMGVKVPSKPEGLIGKKDSWDAAVDYLEVRLTKVLKPFSALDEGSRRIGLEALNQATWPGWIRQERAKRQGHEAEGRIAQLLFNLGFDYEPKEKAVNPMCKDIQIDGVSFDLISPNITNVGLCFKSTVQTSNIGQFGESKGALEVSEARDMLRKKYPKTKVVLMAMVDGIGFQTNTAGLHGILDIADEFCQFKTLWKAGVVSAHAQSKKVLLNIPDQEEHKEFLDRYSHVVTLTNEVDSTTMLEAGEGWLAAHS